MVLELLNCAHHIREMDFRDLPQIWTIIYPQCAHLLNLTDQNWTFAPIYRKSIALESKCFFGYWRSKIVPTIYPRWILGICLGLGYNLSTMCSFDEFNRSKLDICTNLQKKHCIGEKLLFGVLELLNSAHHIRQMDFRDLPKICK